MNAILKYSCFILLVLCGAMPLKATHIYGGYFSYAFIDSFTIAYQLTMESDCGNGTNVEATMELQYLTDTGSIKESRKLTNRKQLNGSRLCEVEMRKRCDQFNLLSGGIKKWVFFDTIYLKGHKLGFHYDSIRSIKIEGYFQARYKNHTTIYGSSGGLIYLMINLKNRFGKGPEPAILLPIVQDVLRYNPGFTDPDQDSLSFEWIEPLDGNGQAIAYNTPNQLPASVWFAPGYKYPQSHPLNNPPSGFYFDKASGDLVYTINKTENGPLVYLVKEWGIDENGKRYLKSESLFEQLLSSNSSQSNFAPEVQGPETINLTEGDTMDVQYSVLDRPYPISPGKFLYNDTVRTLSFFNRETVSYLWSISDSTAVRISGRLRRIIQDGDSKRRWYQFYIKALDNHCFSPMISVKTVNVEIRNEPAVALKIDSLGCGSYLLQGIPDTANMGPLNHHSSIRSLSTQNQNFKTAVFSSGSAYTDKSLDTIRIFRPGDYEISHTINYPGFDKKVSYTDTIFFRDTFPEIVETEDTFYCFWDSLTLSLDSSKYMRHSLKWSLEGTKLKGDYEVSVRLDHPKRQLLQVEGQSRHTGCKHRDWLYVSEVPGFNKVLGNDTFPCRPFELTLKLPDELRGKWAQRSVLWSDKSRADSMIVNQPGSYWVNVENYCGHYTDTIDVIDAYQRSKTYPDLFFCEGDSMQISSSLNVDYYRWNTGDSSRAIQVKRAGLYHVSVQSACGDPFIQYYRVRTHRRPQLFLQDELVSCDSISDEVIAGNVDAFTEVTWSDSLYAGSLMRSFQKEGTYYLTAGNLCGEFVDSIRVLLPRLPLSSFPSDSSFCEGDSIWLTIPASSVELIWTDYSHSGGKWFSEEGTYRYTLQNQCDTLNNQVVLSTIHLPQISLPNDTLLSDRDSLLLGPTPETGIRYLWNTGDTLSRIFVGNPGLYILEATNICGSFKDSIFVTRQMGVFQPAYLGMEVYPIPFGDKLMIKSEEPIESVQILDINGRVLIEHDLPKLKYIELPTPHLMSGTYLLRCQSVNSSYVQMLIVRI
jgi:hypothetical protein